MMNILRCLHQNSDFPCAGCSYKREKFYILLLCMVLTLTPSNRSVRLIPYVLRTVTVLQSLNRSLNSLPRPAHLAHRESH